MWLSSSSHGATADTGASQSVLDFALQLHTIHVKTWKEFYACIAGEKPTIEEDVVDENTATLESAKFRTNGLLDEVALQAMLPVLLPLVNYVVEDTHATVRNYAARKFDKNGNETYETDHNGVLCQRCALARSDGASLRP